MGLSERGLEYYRHLDDLLPPPTDASTLAASARSGDVVQDVHQCGCDARRVRRALLHPRDRLSRHPGPKWTAHICIWICLEHVLCMLNPDFSLL
jgi:hypothetical protein